MNDSLFKRVKKFGRKTPAYALSIPEGLGIAGSWPVAMQNFRVPDHKFRMPCIWRIWNVNISACVHSIELVRFDYYIPLSVLVTNFSFEE